MKGLIRSVIVPCGAAVFAHLSPEYSVAQWHNSTSNEDRIRPTVSLPALAQLIRDELQPSFFRIQTDSQLVAQQPQWIGRLRGDSGQYSALMLRWLLLLNAVKDREEAAGGRRRRKPAWLLG